MKYGLIGEKLGHSFSKEIHESLGGYSYEICELAPADVAPFLQARQFEGINVTIPYKETVIPYLDAISNTARAIGAVNTIVNIDGRLYGDNTDFYGMRSMITGAGIEIKDKKVLVLGTGGTSKTARAVLSDLEAAQVITVSRNKSDSTVTYEEAIELHSDADVILNTTPVGMYPDIRSCPIDISHFPALCGVIDAVYNPLRTRLICAAEERSIPSVGGLMMLILQAARAVEIFSGNPPDSELICEVTKNIFTSKENIVLIGMPGCGKTTIGKEIAKLTSRSLVDTDVLITKLTGRSPATLINELGEEKFRAIETRAVAEVAKRGGLVIATGGGVVTREENVTLLSQNGCLVYLDCPLPELVPTPDRPLSSSYFKLSQLHEVRDPLYIDASDIVIRISHKNPPSVAAEEIISKFTERY